MKLRLLAGIGTLAIIMGFAYLCGMKVQTSMLIDNVDRSTATLWAAWTFAIVCTLFIALTAMCCAIVTWIARMIRTRRASRIA